MAQLPTLPAAGKAKADWISQMSMAFLTYGGRFVGESEGDIEVRFKHLHGVSRRLFLRDVPRRDVQVFTSVFTGGDYAPVQEYAAGLYGGNPGGLRILDVGAHVGLSTLYLKTLFPEAAVRCVEADPGNVRQLKKNIRANGLRGVWVRQGTLGDATPGPAGATDTRPGDAWDGVHLLKIGAGEAQALFAGGPRWQSLLHGAGIVLIDAPAGTAARDKISQALTSLDFRVETTEGAILARKA